MKNSKCLIENVMPTAILNANPKALKIFKNYRKTSDILNKTNLALGRKQEFKSPIGSTLDLRIDSHAIASTTAKKI